MKKKSKKITIRCGLCPATYIFPEKNREIIEEELLFHLASHYGDVFHYD